MIGLIFRAALIVVLIVGLYGAYKPLPPGLDLAGPEHELSNSSIHFYRDVTYTNSEGMRQSDQQIFDEIFRMIDGAQEYLLLDMFFYSDFLGTGTSSYRQLARELTDKLVAKKQQNPGVTIQVITDPINTMYGGFEPEHFARLKESNISVIVTDLRPLRDTNPLYSAFWRTFFRWIPDELPGHVFPNPLDMSKPKVPIQAYFDSFNFKANHRKVVVADYQQGDKVGIATLVTSANPHDGSSAHTNTAIKVDEYIWRDAIESERATAAFSHVTLAMPSENLIARTNASTDIHIDSEETIKTQFLTERAVERKIIEQIDTLKKDDSLDMAMFYLSDRHIVRELEHADQRGVAIRLLLDANKDAFGREKNGIPNRQVAHELLTDSAGTTQVRWCDTHGEQCHSKILIFKHGETHSMIQGSANLTSRNLDNLTLESDIFIAGSASTTAIADARRYFETAWNNDGNNYSLDYAAYADTSVFKTVWYRIGEFTGMSRY